MHKHQSTQLVAWLLLVAFVIPATGCHWWQVTKQPWPQTVSSKPVARYRIVTVDGRYLEADTIRVAGDSVFGFREARASALHPEMPPPVIQGWLPVTQVGRVEEHRFSGVRTTILVAVVGLAAWMLTWTGGN